MASVNFNIFGSYFPMVYYMFYCHTWLRLIYSLLQFISFVILQTCSVQDWFYLPSNVRLRSNLFTMAACISGLPIIHAIFVSQDDPITIDSEVKETQISSLSTTLCGLICYHLYLYSLESNSISTRYPRDFGLGTSTSGYSYF